MKQLFKEHGLGMKVLFQLKWEFQRRDLFAFSLANPQELAFFIENVNLPPLPEAFVRHMYHATVNPHTRKINFSLLKQFIDVCQDSHLNTEMYKAREIKEVIQGAGYKGTSEPTGQFREEMRPWVVEIDSKI